MNCPKKVFELKGRRTPVIAHPEKCIENCRKCIEICPMNALYKK